jgi:hypothetical protein
MGPKQIMLTTIAMPAMAAIHASLRIKDFSFFPFLPTATVMMIAAISSAAMAMK